MKKHYTEKRRQWWLSPNNCISNNGNVCPKNIGIASLRKIDYRHSIAKKIWPSCKSTLSPEKGFCAWLKIKVKHGPRGSRGQLGVMMVTMRGIRHITWNAWFGFQKYSTCRWTCLCLCLCHCLFLMASWQEALVESTWMMWLWPLTIPTLLIMLMMMLL